MSSISEKAAILAKTVDMKQYVPVITVGGIVVMTATLSRNILKEKYLAVAATHSKLLEEYRR